MLIETPSGNLPQIMRHINGAYTTYFNVKRARSGHLFQGRYKAILVEIDEYARSGCIEILFLDIVTSVCFQRQDSVQA